MNNLTKLVACLYAGMVVASAEQTITFKGTNQECPINFEVENHDDSIILKKVSINKAGVQVLKNKEGNGQIKIKLEIPAMVNGQHVVIGEPEYRKVFYDFLPESEEHELELRGAFSGLRSNDVQLTINFIEDDDNNHVQLPNNCSELFSGSDSITEISGIYSQTQVTNTQGMFRLCRNLMNLDLSNFNTTNVTDMGAMFAACESLTSLDLSNFNTQNVTDMRSMFGGCESLKSLDLSNFNTTNVTDMAFMFDCCENLTSLDLSNFNTTKVTDMGEMFQHCSNLSTLNLSHFNTQNVKIMDNMFFACQSLQTLDLSNFNTQNVTDMSCMFYGCESLTHLNTSEYFVTQNANNKEDMFENCNSLLNTMLVQ